MPYANLNGSDRVSEKIDSGKQKSRLLSKASLIIKKRGKGRRKSRSPSNMFNGSLSGFNSPANGRREDKSPEVFEKVPFLFFPNFLYNDANKGKGLSDIGSFNLSSKNFVSFNALKDTEEFKKQTDPYLKKNKKDILQNLNVKLSFNKKKRKRHMCNMKNKAKNYYNQVMKMSSEWSNRKSGNVLIYKRTEAIDIQEEKSQGFNKNSKKLNFFEELTQERRKAKMTKSDKKGRNEHPNFVGVTKEIREADSKISTQMAWLDNSELFINKNFPSTEGIGSVYYKGRVFFFGGIGLRDNLKVSVYDVNKHHFSTMEVTSMIPAGRCFHSMTALNGIIALFGGESSQIGFGSRIIYKELWFLHLKSRKWERVKANGMENVEARKHHAMCKFGNYLLMSGGEGDDDVFLSDFWGLDYEQLIWKKVMVEIDGWKPLAYHTMVPVYANQPRGIYTKPLRGGIFIGPKVRFFIFNCFFSRILRACTYLEV